MADVLPNWGVIYLSEADALRQDHHPTSSFGHTVYRNWPGEGSVAMQFIVRRRVRHLARNVSWKGRCGALHLFRRDTNTLTNNHINIYIIGVHCPHGDEQVDTLADLAHLLRRRPGGSKVLVVGDWNIDQLPVLSYDPYRDKDDREQHHHPERMRLQTLIDRFRLLIVLPSAVHSVLGGPFSLACSMAPISRIPTGETTEYCTPSLLDYGLATPGLVTDSGLHWQGAPADHAVTVFNLQVACLQQRPPKTTWKCVDESACKEWIRVSAPNEFTDLDAFHGFVLETQARYADTRTCKQRRYDRLPLQIRDLYAQLASTQAVLAKAGLELEKKVV